jgi:hypothetical protein
MSEPLQGWHEFYFMIGTSAAALTGPMFVVVSINPENIGRRPASGVRGFVAPTMVFFTTAFLVSALFLVPGLPQRSLAVLLMATGIGGIVYMLWTRVHHHWHHGFPDQPPTRDPEDLVFFVSLPFVSYALLCLAALGLWLEKALRRSDARHSDDVAGRDRHPQRLGPRHLGGAAAQAREDPQIKKAA